MNRGPPVSALCRCQELIMLLRRGRSLEDLWAVARGERSYADLMEETRHALEGEGVADGGRSVEAGGPEAQPRAQPEVDVPTDLVAVQAYLLWQEAGRRDGSDFGDQARRLLADRIRSGVGGPPRVSGICLRFSLGLQWRRCGRIYVRRCMRQWLA